MNRAQTSSPATPSPSSATVRRVRVRASSRLHFGLFSWGGTARQFGGVGVMVDRPGLELVAEAALPFATSPERRSTAASTMTQILTGSSPAPNPPSSDDAVEREHEKILQRVRQFEQRWSHYYGNLNLPEIQWQVREVPAQHVGLGTGTQLGLAVAAALARLRGGEEPSVEELATSVGRGLRSAIGAYGFKQGGLILELGKLPNEPLSPLERRIAVPEEWRFVLVRPRIAVGLHGSDEIQAFRQLPPVAPTTSAALLEIARRQMIPAVEHGDVERFGESVYQFGLLAGSCFTPIQGGPFRGPLLTALVEKIRRLGVKGVGQSSWGPTLFAVLPNESNARQFTTDLLAQSPEPLDIVVTAADNAGAKIDVD